MPNNRIKPLIFVADDDKAHRRFVREQLESAGYRVREYDSSATLRRDLEVEEPACILRDLYFANTSGVDHLRWLRSRGRQTPVIFITSRGTIPNVIEAMKLGAMDVVEKPVLRGLLLARVEIALREGTRRSAATAGSAQARRLFASLTPREVVVARMLLDGLISKEIAKRLSLSPRTVEHHRANVLRKMKAANVPDLARMLGQTRGENVDGPRSSSSE